MKDCNGVRKFVNRTQGDTPGQPFAFFSGRSGVGRDIQCLTDGLLPHLPDDPIYDVMMKVDGLIDDQRQRQGRPRKDLHGLLQRQIHGHRDPERDDVVRPLELALA